MNHYEDQNGFANKDFEEVTVKLQENQRNKFVNENFQKVSSAAYDAYLAFYNYCVCRLQGIVLAEFSDDFSKDFDI